MVSNFQESLKKLSVSIFPLHDRPPASDEICEVNAHATRDSQDKALPQAHLETGQYKNSLRLEAAQYNTLC